ncbi:DUF7683 domain-containing protein [Reinekea marina]|uniref:DUF7683 domain-containing protein n=1 Tax=Reinekea marina TaxID=1310421 RepID=UPI003F4953CC
MNYRMVRTLTCFTNETERLVFDVKLVNFNLGEFQKEFDVPKENLMYDCFGVGVANLPFLKQYLPDSIAINWDFNSFSYFVEAVEG